MQLIGGVCFASTLIFAIVIIFGLKRRIRSACRFCQHENRPHARFCAQCGKPLA